MIKRKLAGVYGPNLNCTKPAAYSSKRPSAAEKRQIRRRCKDETQDRT